MNTLKRLAAVFTVMAIALCGSGNSVSAYQWNNVMHKTSGSYITSLVLSGSNIVAGTWDGLFISGDGGESWNKAGGFPENNSISVKKLTKIGENIIADTTKTIPGYIYYSYQAFFISRDNGKSWSEGIGLPSGTKYGKFSIIAVNGSYALAKAEYGYPFLSADNGESWQEITLGGNVFAISGSNIISGTNQGIILSDDNGASWKKAIGVSSDIRADAFTISGSNVIVGTNQGTFISDDNGASWKKAIGLPDSLVYFTVSGSDVIAALGSEVFGEVFGYSLASVFISSDNGATWKAINRFSDNGLNRFSISGSNFIAINDGKGLFVSADKGETWNKATGLPDIGLKITAINAPYVAVAASPSSSYYTTYLSADNGASWKEVKAGWSHSSVDAFAVSDTGIFALTSKGLFLSSDNGISWNEVKNPPYKTRTLAARGTDVFAGTAAGVYLSADNGATWKEICNTTSDVMVLAIDGDRIIAGTASRGAYISADNGATWKQKDINLSADRYSSVYAVAFSGSDIFASVNTSVFLSADNGENWTETNKGLPSKAYPYTWAVSGSYIFGGIPGWGVYLSSDKGISWTAANTGLPSGIYFRALTVSGSYLFAGTDKGVFVSRDNGGTWESAGLDKDVSSLVIKDSKLFAGTDMNCEIWVADISSECLNVGDDLSLNISCAEYQGKKFAFNMNYDPDSSGFFWKPDISTFREIQSAGNCIPVGENLSLNISCAQFRGKKYGFVLNYDGDSRWKMDVGTFSEK